MGDPCDRDDDCDHDWVCSSGICQVYTSPPKRGLDTGAAVGIGVAVPVTVAIILGIAYLVWRSRRRKSVLDKEAAARRGFWKPELGGTPVHPPPTYQKKQELEGSPGSHATEMMDISTIINTPAGNDPVELEGDVAAPSGSSMREASEKQDLSLAQQEEPEVSSYQGTEAAPSDLGIMSPLTPQSRPSGHSRNFSYPIYRTYSPLADMNDVIEYCRAGSQ